MRSGLQHLWTTLRHLLFESPSYSTKIPCVLTRVVCLLQRSLRTQSHHFYASLRYLGLVGCSRGPVHVSAISIGCSFGKKYSCLGARESVDTRKSRLLERLRFIKDSLEKHSRNLLPLSVRRPSFVDYTHLYVVHDLHCSNGDTRS